jgi:hypothetical protein
MVNNHNDLQQINNWLSRAERLITWEELPFEKLCTEITDLDAAIKSLQGTIPDADYREVSNRLEGVKFRVSLVNPRNHEVIFLKTLNFISKVAYSIFR